MRRFIRYLLLSCLFILLIPVTFLVISTLREFRPEPYEIVTRAEGADTLDIQSGLNILIWNIGYAGLGSNMDFFYDGGMMVRDAKSGVEKNLKQIESFLYSNDSLDFILLQEVDRDSRRSYGIDQYQRLSQSLHDFSGSFAWNYRSGFVPLPLREPMGRVSSGLATFSIRTPFMSERRAYQSDYKWPTRAFMLKRCFLVCRYNVREGRELVVINLHNSAYDDGSLRAAQLEHLAHFAVKEYELGNYVVMAGDWNQTPARFSSDFSEPFDTVNISFMPDSFLEDWHAVYPEEIPTNRRVVTPYEQNKTPVTVIDFFYLSPNLRPLEMKCVHLGFANSDHNPVILKFKENE